MQIIGMLERLKAERDGLLQEVARQHEDGIGRTMTVMRTADTTASYNTFLSAAHILKTQLGNKRANELIEQVRGKPFYVD